MLRWYPREWRARYGEEFTELLVSDMSERSRSVRTPADVAVNGIVAGLAYAGLGQSTLEDAERYHAERFSPLHAPRPSS